MAVLLDYLDWRGDLPFSLDPANEADYYLISKIGCPDLTNLVPFDEREVPLKAVMDGYRAQTEKHPVPLGTGTSPRVMESFYRLPSVPRFQSLMLSGFRRIDDHENTEQFSALTVRIPDGPLCVTFRGTDDNLFAWKENFHMSIMDTVPAQEDALRYLRWAMYTYEGSFIVCGHSKGGNLAIYAASLLPPEMQDRIIAVYDFDGPGFQDAFLKKEGYLRLLPRLHSIVPENSIVGMLLSTGKEPEVVACDSFGAKAHDGFTWQVLGTGFVRAKGLSRSSAMFNRAMDETLADMSQQDREAFIENFFEIMTSTGAFTLTDLTEMRLNHALEIVRSLGRDKEVQKFALSMLSNSLMDMKRRV